MEGNPIYKFMRENNLTQLDEESFLNKYSDPNEAKKIHSFMRENNLTQLNDSDFYSKYLSQQQTTQPIQQEVAVEEPPAQQPTQQQPFTPTYAPATLASIQRDTGATLQATDENEPPKLEQTMNMLYNTWQGTKKAFLDLGVGIQMPQYKLERLIDTGVQSLQDRFDVADETATLITEFLRPSISGAYIDESPETVTETLAGVSEISAELGSRTRYVKPALDAIKEGDALGIALGAVNGAMGYVPSIMVGAATGGLGFIPMFAGSGFVDGAALKAELNDTDIKQILESDEADVFVPALMGGIAGWLESRALTGMKELVTKKVLSEKGLNVAKDILFESGRQGFINWLEGGLMHYNLEYAKTGDYVDSAKEMGNWLISEEGVNAGIEAALGTVVTGGVGRGVQRMRRPTPMAQESVQEEVLESPSGIEQREFGGFNFIGKNNNFVFQDGMLTQSEAESTVKELESKYPGMSFAAKDNTDISDPTSEANFTIVASPKPQQSYKLGEQDITREQAQEAIENAESLADLEVLSIQNDQALMDEVQVKREELQLAEVAPKEEVQEEVQQDVQEEVQPSISTQSGNEVTVRIAGENVSGTVQVDEGGKVTLETPQGRIYELEDSTPFTEFVRPVSVSEQGDIEINGEPFVEARIAVEDGQTKALLIREDGTTKAVTNPRVVEEIEYQIALANLDSMSDQDADNLINQYEQQRETEAVTEEGVTESDETTADDRKLQEALEEIELIEQMALEELEQVESSAKLVEMTPKGAKEPKVYLVSKNEDGTYSATLNGRRVKRQEVLDQLGPAYESETRNLVGRLQEQVNQLKADVEQNLFGKKDEQEQQADNQELLEGVREEGNEGQVMESSEQLREEEQVKQKKDEQGRQRKTKSTPPVKADTGKKGKGIVPKIRELYDKKKQFFDDIKKEFDYPSNATVAKIANDYDAAKAKSDRTQKEQDFIDFVDNRIATKYIKPPSQKGKKPLDERIKKGKEKQALGVQPTSILDVVQQWFINGGRISNDALKSVFGGGGKSIQGERNARMSYFRTPEKGGLGLDAIVETITNDLTDQFQGIDQMQIKNAVETTIKDFNSIAQMAKGVLERNNLEISAREKTPIDQRMFVDYNDALNEIFTQKELEEATPQEKADALNEYYQYPPQVDFRWTAEEVIRYEEDQLNPSVEERDYALEMFDSMTQEQRDAMEQDKMRVDELFAEEEAQPYQELKPKEPSKPDFSKDINLKTAQNAYRAISFDAEKRGQSEVDDYVNSMEKAREEVDKLAETQEQKEVLEKEFENYRQGVIKRTNDYLAAKSRTMSSMITGPAKFPVERNRKALESEAKRRDELIDFKKRGLESVKKKIENAASPEQKAQKVSSEAKRQYDIAKEDGMFIINGMNKFKTEGKSFPYSPQLLKDSLARKIVNLAKIDAPLAQSLLAELNDDAKSKGLKPLFSDKNKIFEDVNRVAQAEAQKEEGTNIVYESDNIRIENNKGDERLRIITPEKPSSDIISRLKSEGWRWSPTNKAWQRKNTNQSLYSAKKIFGITEDVSLEQKQPTLKEKVEQAKKEVDQDIKNVKDNFTKGGFDQMGAQFDFKKAMEADKKFYDSVVKLVGSYVRLKGLQAAEIYSNLEKVLKRKLNQDDRKYLKGIIDSERKSIPKVNVMKENQDLTKDQQVKQGLEEILDAKFKEFKDKIDKERQKSKSEKDRIKGLRDSFAQFIRDNSKDINNLGAKLNTAILNKVNNIKTELMLDRAIEYTEKVLTDQKFRNEIAEKESLIADIKKESDPRNQVKKESGVLKSKRRQTADAIRVMSLIDKAIGMNRVDAETRMQTIQEELYNGNLTAEQEFNLQSELYALNFSGLEMMDNTTLKQKLGELKEIKKQDRVVALKELEEYKQKVAENVENAVKTINPGVKEVKSPHVAKKSDFRKDSKLRAFSLAMNSFNMVLDKLSKFDKTSEMGKSWLNKFAMGLTRKMEQSEQTSRRKVLSDVQENYKKIFGEDFQSTVFNNTIPQDFKYTDINGNVVEIEISQNEAYKRWMEAQDETLATTLEKMGYGTEYINALEEFMTPETKKWAEWQLKEFYPKYGKELNKTYRDVFGVDMPMNENYSPIYRTQRNVKEDTNLLLSGQNIMNTVNNGSLKARQGSTLPLAYMDGDRVLVNYVYQMEFFKSHAKPLKELNATLFNAEVANNIEQVHGREYLISLRSFMDDFYRKPEKYIVADSIISNFRKNFTVASLALNPVTFIKQLTSIPAYSSFMPAGNWVADQTFWKNPIENGKFLYENSEYLQNRYEAGFDRDMMMGMRSDYKRDLTDGNTFASKMMILTRYGDMAAILVGGWPVYRHYYKQGKSQGMTDQQAKEHGIAQFEAATEQAQQAANTKDMSAFQRGGEFYKVMTMYMTSPIQYHNLAMGALRNAFAGRGDLSQNLKTFAVFHMLLPTIFQWTSMGFRFPDEEEEVYELLRAAAFGNINSVFVVGNFIDYLIKNTIEGKPFEYNVNNVAQGLFSDAKKSINSVTKLIENENRGIGDVADAIDKMARTASNVVAPLAPYKQVSRTVGGVRAIAEDETEFPVRRAIGWTDWALGENPSANRQRNKILEMLYGKDYKKKKKEVEQGKTDNIDWSKYKK